MIAGIVGAAGLAPTLAAARAGKRILLANKETLVLAGALFMAAVREGGATLLPIDSEHNAIFQCLPSRESRCRAARRPAHPAHRFGRTIPAHRNGDSWRSVTPDAGVRAPELAHGTQDLGRFRDHDEQGTRSHRGALAVRCGRRCNRGRDPSAEHRAFAWSNTSTARCSRSSAIPTCARPSRRRSPGPIASTRGGEPRSDARSDRSISAHPTPHAFLALALAYAALRAGGERGPAMLNAANEVAVARVSRRRGIGFLDIAAVCETARCARYRRQPCVVARPTRSPPTPRRGTSRATLI